MAGTAKIAAGRRPAGDAPSAARHNWDDLRFLLAVARAGSLRGAAIDQRVSVNTVRARIARLEARERTLLMRRSHEGVTLTEAGERLIEIAREMRVASFDRGGGAGDALVSPTELTIACTEGLGSLWLTPRVGDLLASLPDRTVRLEYDYDLSRDRSAMVDIGLTYDLPRDPELIVSRLATLHFLLFASPGYVLEHGAPRTADDLAAHRFVEQSGKGYNPTLLKLLTGVEPDPALVRIRTNSSLAQFWATVNGAGIAMLPSYARAITRAVVPLEPVLQMRFPLYYYYHAAAKQSPVVQAGIAWLRQSFDPVAFPWFSERFVHPDDFPREDRCGQVVSLFDKMVDRIG